jgi:long-chain acyl-CoA synthetase
VALTPRSEAFRHPVKGGWASLTWEDTAARVRAVAMGLAALGLEAEGRCAILASTRLEWILADLGILCAGGATTTIYPSSTADECAFILSDSGAAFAFAESDEQVAKIAARRADLPALRKVITFDGQPGADGWVITLGELERLGRQEEAARPGRFEELARSPGPGSLATLIYTSGTTGRPKGVELTHDSWVYEGEAIDASGLLPKDPVHFLWLPLAHSFGKVLIAAQLRLGFVTAVDGRLERMIDNLAEVKPSFVCAVPRVFEKVHNKILASGRSGGAVKRGVFDAALAAGREASRLRQAGKRPGLALQARLALAERLVFHKIRALFGGRLQFFVSGSAPLSKDVAELFDALGVLVLQGYGLTESSAASFCNRPRQNRLGTVGPPLPGTEVRIAPDGEVLLRGRSIMRGYHGLPEDTREALQDGWLHTGDVGQLDADGFLTITDRKKDLIKTSGGKYVAPQELELKLKAICPYVSQVIVHGDNRKYVSALVTLDEEAVRKWARDQGLPGSGPELAARPEVRALIQQDVDRLNAGLPRFATVKRFTILPQDFTEAAGELTASQKPKRKAIEKKYRAALDAMYEESAAA